MIGFINNKYKAIINLYNITRKEGLNATWRAIKKSLRGAPADENLYLNYVEFLKLHQLTSEAIEKVKNASENFVYRPLISIIVPVYNIAPEWLERCIKSVVNQYYANWELCLYDDCSTNQSTIACLQKWETIDPKIKIGYGKQNRHISEASNCAIALTKGEFIGILDNDDELTPDALYEVVAALNNNPNIDFIYSDEDKMDKNCNLSAPFFKPDFSPDLFLTNNYICHFSVIRKSLGESVGWFRKGYEGSQDYDLFLRLFEKTKEIHHISKVLYHWRMLETSTSAQGSAKSYALEAAKRALEDYVKSNKIAATVENGLWFGSFYIKREIAGNPLVSIIIPFKDKVTFLKQCLESILTKSTYTNIEILLVNNNSLKKETILYLDTLRAHPQIRILNYEDEFNFAAINNFAVTHSKGDFLLLLNNDTKVISPNWIEAMLRQVQRPEVGAVGVKLLYPNNTVQHAGILLGVGGIANHAYYGMDKETTAYWGHLHTERNYSAITGACLMTKKSTYLLVNGLNENDFKIAFNDIDFCLKLQQKGLFIVYTPYSVLYHYESISRGSDVEMKKKERLDKESVRMKKEWGMKLNRDPYYNKNLSKLAHGFNLDVV